MFVGSFKVEQRAEPNINLNKSSRNLELPITYKHNSAPHYFIGEYNIP